MTTQTPTPCQSPGCYGFARVRVERARPSTATYLDQLLCEPCAHRAIVVLRYSADTITIRAIRSAS